jgi:hypothetical protein
MSNHVLTLVFRPDAADLITIVPSWTTMKVAHDPAEFVSILEEELSKINVSQDTVRKPGGFGEALRALTAKPHKQRELVYDFDEAKLVSLKEVDG